LGMYNFMSERTINMGPIFGFSVLVCVLPIVLFISLQKYFYKGIVAGAVKG
jgi:raffinose/stachyose/melibiose transport system permease protein